MLFKEIRDLGLDLWVYTPSSGEPRTGRYFNSRPWQAVSSKNVYVILGSFRCFHNIKSKTVLTYTVAKNVEGDEFLNAFYRAEGIYEEFNFFLRLAIGTCNKESKEYQEFLQRVGDFKAYIMKKILQEV